MLVTNVQADELLSMLSELSGLDRQLSETCRDLVRAQRYDEAVSRAFVVLEERLRGTLGVRGGSGVHLSEKAFAPDSGDLVDRLARPRGEVDGIRDLFAGAFKAYRNRAAHTMAGYTLDEARAIIHLVNLLLLILEQVREAPAHPIRQDVAVLLEPEALRRVRSFLGSLDDIGIRKGDGKSKTPYRATLEYHRPSRDVPGPHDVTLFYLHVTGGKPVLSFRGPGLERVVGLDVDSWLQDLLRSGCARASAKSTPVRLHLDRQDDQETFGQLFGVLRGLVERHRVSRVPPLREVTADSRGRASAETKRREKQLASEGTEERTSKYDPLCEFLKELPSDVQERTLSFRQIESILGFALPASARRHRAWWSNPSSRGHHSHAQAWLAADWEVDTVDQRDEWVRLRRAH